MLKVTTGNAATDAAINDIAVLQQAEDALEGFRYHGAHRAETRRALFAAVNVLNELRRAQQAEVDEAEDAATRRVFNSLR